MIKEVRKRNGEIAPFDSLKIQHAIEKAMQAVDEKNKKAAEMLTKEIVKNLELNIASFLNSTPTVEQIQNIVEDVLAKSKLKRTAKAYMLYRRARTNARELKKFFGIKDDLKFDVNAIRVLQERYLLKDEDGKIIESPTQLFRRVAKAVAEAEDYEKRMLYSVKFFRMMSNLEFLPNSPTLMNAETKLGQLSACFVLPVEDSLDSIFTTLKQTAVIQQSGGGTGFNFSNLRPKGDLVKSTKGVASGPVSFIKIFDATTETIKQGGKRRGANMAILNINHPDIMEFILSKQGEKQLSNFNISVAVNDKFISAVDNNRDYNLVNPRTGEVAGKMNAREIFRLICRSAWHSGDPGMIFIDEINRKNQLPGVGNIHSTNPCGEVPLLPYESCNLGSINLTKFVKDERIDWQKLGETIHLAVRFLDNVITVNHYPFSELEEIALANRRIGLGVMGFAEMLIMLKIPYDSNRAISISEKLMSFINSEAHNASMQLGKERGNFPNFNKSVWSGKVRHMRNCACTTIAPTGTISIIAGCSSGIEPLFAVAFVREVLAGKHLYEVNKTFENLAIKKGFYSDELIHKIILNGTLKGVKLPKDIKNLFKTALDIPLEQHVKIQAAFQKYTDNAVSKTINLSENSTIEDVKKAYLLAYKLKCKGITLYRYGSKSEQVLYLGQGKSPSHAKMDFAGTCIGKVCTF